MSRAGTARTDRTANPRRVETGKRGARPGKSRRPLSRERIIDTAIALVEEQGLAAFSTRRLGQALGCEAMSIYHHFPSKQHLLDALIERAIAGIGEPPRELDPIERLRVLGLDYRAMAHRFPKLFQLIALHRHNMPAGVAFIERVLGHFRAAVPDERLAAQAFRVFGYYLVGGALDETAGYAKGPSAAEPVDDDFIALHCPHLDAAAPYFKRPYFDSTFALGFDIMLKGIAELRAIALSRRATG